MGARQRLVREVIGWRDVDRTPCLGQRSIERPGPDVESVAVLVRIDPRQHRPAIRVRRRLLDGALERVARLRMFVRRQPKVISQAAHERFVRREQAGVPAADGFADAARDHADHVRARRDDARNEIVLQREDLIGLEAPIVGLRPEMCAGRRVHELHRHAHRRRRVADAAFHHVSRLPRRRAARDDAQVRKP